MNYCKCGCGVETAINKIYVLGHNRRKPIMDRFWARIVIDDYGCWLWQGARTKAGYGMIGDGLGPTSTIYTHILAYTYYIGPVPKGYVLDHFKCIRQCANPLHVRPLTTVQNVMRSPLHPHNLKRNGLPQTKRIEFEARLQQVRELYLDDTKTY